MSCQTLSDTLLRDISNLYDKADDYNVKIQVGEDSKMEIFKAHSVILRARSNYFRSAFSLNWAKKEGDFYVFKKPNVTPIVFQIILKYIYTGTVALDTVNVENNFIELLLAADEMNLHELIEHLQQHIINLSRLNNDWIIQNGVKLFNIIFNRKGVFPKLEELCNNIMIQDPKLFINSNEFWGVKHNDSAVSDDNDRNQGFGRGDLYIFKQSCKLVNYSTEIHDSENFEIYDYEVFQIIKK
ncbi:unnamed protein product [Rhizophagus irregularis]|nr:unnamed protein product [Rhizophagus irregularis]